MKYNEKNVVLSASIRDYCEKCLLLPVDLMLQCNHVNTKLYVPHKSDASKAVIKYICDKFDEDAIYEEENENIASSTLVKVITPIYLNLLFKPKYFYDDTNLLKNNDKIIVLTCDPNGAGMCDYGLAIGYFDMSNANTIVFLFLFLFLFF